MTRLHFAAMTVLGLAACSPSGEGEVQGNAPALEANLSGRPTEPPPPIATPAEPTPSPILTLEGLGDLRVGQAVPAGSGWAARGAQVPGSCRTVSNADYPGVYAIVEGGEVRRITVGEGSAIKLVEGIGPGSTEARVRSAFAGFREAPHEYGEPPAKYLTAPNAESGDPALRFEIDAGGKVSLVHVGVMPVLGYVEGCA